jgi:hypothetical protein
MTLMDRRADEALVSSTAPVAGSAAPRRRPRPRWSLLTDGGGTTRTTDAWVALVRESLDHYAAGKVTAASRIWLPDIVWHLTGASRFSGDHVGRDGIVRYHRALDEASAGTFQQTLMALDGSGGPLVEAHLRSVAVRGRRAIDMATLLVFELSAGGIRRITELPGDQSLWDGFWGPLPER